MVDKILINKRFSSHFATYQAHAVVQKDICVHLAKVLRSLSLNPKKILEIGAGTGLLTSHLAALYPNSQLYINDLSTSAKPFLDKVTKDSYVNYLFGDAEQIELPSNLDLVATASTIQWFDDVSAFISRLPLTTGGVAAFSSFLPGNFSQINDATQSNGLNYLSKEELLEIFIQNGFQIIYTKEFISNLTFATPIDVLRHLKLTGVNGIKSESWNKAKLKDFCSRYTSQFTTKNGVLLTYEPIIIVAKKL